MLELAEVELLELLEEVSGSDSRDGIFVMGVPVAV